MTTRTLADKGITARYRRNRRLVIQNATHCAICGLPPTPDNPLECGHIIPRIRFIRRGMDPDTANDLSNLRAEHQRCNRAKSATARERKQDPMTTSTQPRSAQILARVNATDPDADARAAARAEARAEADARAEAIRTALAAAADALDRIPALVAEAKDAGDWRTLGYPAWEDYVTAEFGTGLLRLDRAVRREWSRSLKAAGLSTREIAPVVNAGKSTVDRDLSVPDGTGRSTSPAAVDDLSVPDGPGRSTSADLRPCARCGGWEPPRRIYRRGLCKQCYGLLEANSAGMVPGLGTLDDYPDAEMGWTAEVVESGTDAEAAGEIVEAEVVESWPKYDATGRSPRGYHMMTPRDLALPTAPPGRLLSRPLYELLLGIAGTTNGFVGSLPDALRPAWLDRPLPDDMTDADRDWVIAQLTKHRDEVARWTRRAIKRLQQEQQGAAA